jgi:hypothetical protein
MNTFKIVRFSIHNIIMSNIDMQGTLGRKTFSMNRNFVGLLGLRTRQQVA